MKNNNTADILSALSTEKVQVIFTKLTGERRVMNCTKNTQFIPPSQLPAVNEANMGTDYVRVFDLDINEWRSFRKSSVISYQVLD
jgi:hypothetical protein